MRTQIYRYVTEYGSNTRIRALDIKNDVTTNVAGVDSTTTPSTVDGVASAVAVMALGITCDPTSQSVFFIEWTLGRLRQVRNGKYTTCSLCDGGGS